MKQLSTYFLIVNMLKLFGVLVHIATGLTPPKSISHMLGHWLTGINKKDRLLIFVGAALIGAIWCTRNDLALRKIGYLFYACYFQGKQNVRGHRFGNLRQQ